DDDHHLTHADDRHQGDPDEDAPDAVRVAIPWLDKRGPPDHDDQQGNGPQLTDPEQTGTALPDLPSHPRHLNCPVAAAMIRSCDTSALSNLPTIDPSRITSTLSLIAITSGSSDEIMSMAMPSDAS